jgi:16S rRNA (guanine966-N2)-methyltransferase
MRVIGGTYRSRRLIAPRGLATRPTSDRLRETLFNVVAARVEGAVFVDLYAGSGAVGIEALSRGARMVYFVDQAAPALAAIRENLAALEISSGFQVVPGSVSAALRRIAEPCTIVFMDPPYASTVEYGRTLSVLGERAEELLTGDGIVVAEHQRKMPEPLAESYGPLRRYRVLEQGDAGLSFYSR